MTATVHGASYDLEVVRLIRDRILAGDWTQGTYDDVGRHCLVGHLAALDWAPERVLYEAVDEGSLVRYNDTHTQAEVVALLDDVEDSLLGELGVAG